MLVVKRNNGDVPAFSVWDDFLNKDVFNWKTNNKSNVPAVNIKETDENFQVEMAAPGLEKKDFKIELDGQTLTISSENQKETEQKEGESYNRKEFSFQSFYRSFNLPKNVVDGDKIKATYENGILQLEIPKREEAKQKPSRVIEIS